MKRSAFLALVISSALGLASFAAEATKPLRVLLITGGCCHDYKAQKDILKKGIEERANVVVTQIHTDDKSTKPPLPIYGNPDYAKGFDVVIHDECAAGVSDLATIDGVLKPHKDGIPGVNLHCAMHCYRFGDFQKPVAPGADNSHWYEYLGLQSTGHGAQEPIAITFVDKDSPIVKGFADWTTIKEELYNNIQILTAHALAKGRQTTKGKDGTTKETETVVAWTNEYGPKKTRVFSTTIGHNNVTVEDPRYLDLVTRGVLWSAGKLNDDGTPAKGYGPGGK
ncbi:MAG: ThuA domain-containing protein [Chthoniobacteraceae bacterium]